LFARSVAQRRRNQRRRLAWRKNNIARSLKIVIIISAAR
jgi:hypothetical protein